MYTVYKHTLNNKIYIGITRQKPKDRWCYGWGYKECPHFYNAIKKYGWHNVKSEILYTGLTKEAAEQKEIELIAKYHSTDDRYGYNIDKGGSCTGKCSEEHKRKVSERMRGSNNPFYGKKHTEASRLKIKLHHADLRGGSHPKSKAVRCKETNKVYPSVSIAHEETGIATTSISRASQGVRKSAGGLHWEYI